MKKITPVSEVVANAGKIIKWLSPFQAFEMLKNETGILLDLRDVRELNRTEKIEDAIQAPRGMLEFWEEPNSPYHKSIFKTDKALILFCASKWRSALAAKTLMEMGFDRIFDIEGGLTAWIDAGYPTQEQNIQSNSKNLIMEYPRQDALLLDLPDANSFLSN